MYNKDVQLEARWAEITVETTEPNRSPIIKEEEMHNGSFKLISSILFLCLLLPACGGAPQPAATAIPPQPTVANSPEPTQTQPEAISTETPAVAPTEIKHLMKPDQSVFLNGQDNYDCNIGETYTPGSPLTLSKSCDNWLNNFVERPFTSDLKTYLPYLDIVQSRFGANKDWIFASVSPYDLAPEIGTGDVYYIIVFDLNFDGINDRVLAVKNVPSNAVVWTQKGTAAWKLEDISAKQIFDQGTGIDPDLIWVRRTHKSIEFAFKPSLLDDDNRFAWSIWAIQGQFDPNQILPLVSIPDTSYQIDATCAFGFNFDITTTSMVNKCSKAHN
jgi:hypothetical protein